MDFINDFIQNSPILEVFRQDSAALKWTFIILVLMSVLSWTVIIIRSVKLLAAKKQNKRVQAVLVEEHDLEKIEAYVTQNPSPISDLAVIGFNSLKKHRECVKGTSAAKKVPLDEYLTRNIRNGMKKIMRRFDGGLTVLATIGATAPFIGLFGTVLGIYHALMAIGTEGQVSLALVAPAIGEALIATAVGLFAAIPAVLAYNAIARANKTISQDLDAFAHDFHAQLLNSEIEE